MKISLIGMSNSGKTYWSQKLEENGFKRFCCDDLIEEKLGNTLKKQGYSGIADVAKWMGQPYDKQYKQTSLDYLTCEKEVMQEVLIYLQEKTKKNDKIVVDTTGSIIYIDNTIMQQLANYTTIVYLDTPEHVKKEMYESYIKNPKPVIWGNIFHQEKNENHLEALAKCYPKLLEYRTQQYKNYANIIIPYTQQRKQSFTNDDLVKVIHYKSIYWNYHAGDPGYTTALM